jgi:hypothetical protein
MMKLIGVLILIFVIVSIGPALLQKFLGSLNPFNWVMQASKKTTEDAVQDNVDCLKRQARQYGLDADATAACGNKKGTNYIHCMKEFLSTQPVGKDLPEYCAGKNTQKVLKSAPENLSAQKACTYIPRWVPDWLETLVGLGDCVSKPVAI